MTTLCASQPAKPGLFHPDIVSNQPKVVQRFFNYTIKEGTLLYTVASLRMQGRFGMGDKSRPNYLQMMATQILASPTGFIWKMTARGTTRLSGSDSEQWTRFWLLDLIPVARMGGEENHRRSAFGRCIAESVFWTPAAVLPCSDVQWEEVSEHVARVTVHHDGMSQSVDVTLAEDGQPVQVAFARWSNANPQKVFRLQPFGGFLSEYREFKGFRLPTHVEAGNNFGSDEYFPFFVADVTDVEFPDPRHQQSAG